jgi:hypothetical protein
VSTFYKNNGPDWEVTKKTLDEYFKTNMSRISTFTNDAKTTIDDYRDRLVKELVISKDQYRNLLDTVEMHLCALNIPFVNQVFLPIDNYDSLTVKEILPRLSQLNKEQASFLLKYEENHLNRVTLIREFDKLLNQN